MAPPPPSAVPSAPPPAAGSSSSGSGSRPPQDDSAIAPAAPIVLDAVAFLDARRRNLRPHTDAELQWWIESYCGRNNNDAVVKDYQMAAWLMAVCIHGLTPPETAALTAGTVNSGVRLRWDDDDIDIDDAAKDKLETSTSSTTIPTTSRKRRRLPLVDKHSTGGTCVLLNK